MKITYWSDYACPFCYIAKARLKQAIQELKVDDSIEFDMKSFQLDPKGPKETKVTGLDKIQKVFRLSKSDAIKQIESINTMATNEGLDFDFSKSIIARTTDAHRLTKYAQNKEPDKSNRLIEVLLDYYYGKHYNLADPDVLRKAVAEVGLNEVETEKVIKFDTLYLDEVEQDQNQAYSYGISSIPFFIIGKIGISGVQSVDAFKEAIETAMQEENK